MIYAVLKLLVPQKYGIEGLHGRNLRRATRSCRDVCKYYNISLMKNLSF